jgi:hypothetical protein
MKLGANNQYNNRVSFGHNQGVLDTVEMLKKRVTSDKIQELQAHLQDIELTPDFITKIQAYSNDWKQALIKYASPQEIQNKLKTIFGMK